MHAKDKFFFHIFISIFGVSFISDNQFASGSKFPASEVWGFLFVVISIVISIVQNLWSLIVNSGYFSSTDILNMSINLLRGIYCYFNKAIKLKTVIGLGRCLISSWDLEYWGISGILEYWMWSVICKSTIPENQRNQNLNFAFS